jgi:hypothetical protein
LSLFDLERDCRIPKQRNCPFFGRSS